jgi:hypothetical protein
MSAWKVLEGNIRKARSLVDPASQLQIVQLFSRSGTQQSNPANQQQDNQDHQYQAQPATWVISPAAAVWPGRQRANQHQQKDNDQNCEHVDFPLFQTFRWRNTEMNDQDLSVYLAGARRIADSTLRTGYK